MSHIGRAVASQIKISLACIVFLFRGVAVEGVALRPDSVLLFEHDGFLRFHARPLHTEVGMVQGGKLAPCLQHNFVCGSKHRRREGNPQGIDVGVFIRHQDVGILLQSHPVDGDIIRKIIRFQIFIKNCVADVVIFPVLVGQGVHPLVGGGTIRAPLGCGHVIGFRQTQQHRCPAVERLKLGNIRRNFARRNSALRNLADVRVHGKSFRSHTRRKARAYRQRSAQQSLWQKISLYFHHHFSPKNRKAYDLYLLIKTT